MSIERAEKLKELLTDKFVVVDATVPELRRFENWTGKVRTVNMNCRALVEFDGPVDIGWYDIDPDFLKVVEAPVKKAPAAHSAPKATPADAKPAAKPAAAPAAGKSPLDAIRAQQSAKAGTATTAAAAGKSPLDAIRAQQAAKAAGTGSTEAPSGAKLSPMDMIRKQQAAKAAAAAAAGAEVAAAVPAAQTAPVASEPEPAPTPAPVVPKPVPTTGADGKPLSKLDLIRMQGAKK